MDENKVLIKNIDEAFDMFATLISDEKLCNYNQKLLSNFAYQIDAYALATILNFHNKNPESAKKLWQSNLLIIRMYSVVTTEVVKYLSDEGLFNIDRYREGNNYNDIFLLRNKIHQFRYQDFQKNICNIDTGMGRSRNKFKPNLDMWIKYSNIDGKRVLTGTNIYQYHFVEANNQLIVDLMQKIIRDVEGQSFYPPADFVIEKGKNMPEYRWKVYCYTDIIKNTALKNQRVIDRVLLAFDDLCSVLEFFNVTINTDKYLKNAPYLIYYFCKMIAVILDETFDNFNAYILREKDDDCRILKSILMGIEPLFINDCRKMRNNLHYKQQETYILGTVDDMYSNLIKELEIAELIVFRIRKILNINPTKLRLGIYRFLRWVKID